MATSLRNALRGGSAPNRTGDGAPSRVIGIQSPTDVAQEARARQRAGNPGMRAAGDAVQALQRFQQNYDRQREQQRSRLRPGEVLARDRDRAPLMGAAAGLLNTGLRNEGILEAGRAARADAGNRGSGVDAGALAGFTAASAPPPIMDDMGNMLDGDEQALKGGGEVKGLRKQGRGPDNVPLWGTEGEYMLPVETVDKVGKDRLDKLVEKTTGEKPKVQTKRGLRAYRTGGEIERNWVDNFVRIPPSTIDGVSGAAPRRPDGPMVNQIPTDAPPRRGQALPEPSAQPAPEPQAFAPVAAPVERQTTMADVNARLEAAEPERAALRRQMQAEGTGADSGTRGLRALAGNPEMLERFNANLDERGTGIRGSVDANGRMVFSGSGGIAQANYRGADGNPTTDWRNTEDFRQAAIRNASSNDPALQRRGAADLAQIAAMRQAEVAGRSSGDAQVDRLRNIGMDPAQAVSGAVSLRDQGLRANANQRADQRQEFELQQAKDAADARAAAEPRRSQEHMVDYLHQQIQRAGIPEQELADFTRFLAVNYGAGEDMDTGEFIAGIATMDPIELQTMIQRLRVPFEARNLARDFTVSGYHSEGGLDGSEATPQSFRLFGDSEYEGRPGFFGRLFSRTGDVMEYPSGVRIDARGLRRQLRDHPRGGDILRILERENRTRE